MSKLETQPSRTTFRLSPFFTNLLHELRGHGDERTTAVEVFREAIRDLAVKRGLIPAPKKVGGDEAE